MYCSQRNFQPKTYPISIFSESKWNLSEILGFANFVLGSRKPAGFHVYLVHVQYIHRTLILFRWRHLSHNINISQHECYRVTTKEPYKAWMTKIVTIVHNTPAWPEPSSWQANNNWFGRKKTWGSQSSLPSSQPPPSSHTLWGPGHTEGRAPLHFPLSVWQSRDTGDTAHPNFSHRGASKQKFLSHRVFSHPHMQSTTNCCTWDKI